MIGGACLPGIWRLLRISASHTGAIRHCDAPPANDRHLLTLLCDRAYPTARHYLASDAVSGALADQCQSRVSSKARLPHWEVSLPAPSPGPAEDPRSDELSMATVREHVPWTSRASTSWRIALRARMRRRTAIPSSLSTLH